MNIALLIGHNDLRMFLRNKSSYVWLFVMPLIFIGFMGFAFRGPGDPANLQPTVLVDNRDTNYLAAVFLKELGTQGMRVLDPASGQEAQQQIRIPADFTRRILAGEQAKVEFARKENGPPGEAAMVEVRLVRALIRINSHLLAAAGGGNALSETAVRNAQDAPALVRLQAGFAGRKPLPVGFNGSLPGNIVMYVMLNLLIFGGASLAKERQSGVIRRLACNPLTRRQVVAGKIYGLFLLGAVQVAAFLFAGRFLFGVRFGDNLAPILLTLLVYAWVAASLGVLVGSLVQAEDKVVGLCLMASLLMAALGGCWWPLEIVPPALKTVAHCLPTGWAMEALHQLITFGGTLGDAAKPIAFLAAFGVAANCLAAWRFRW
jgi:ABC-2 type transport system permease protein